jgi:hypothetical protein
MEGFSFINEFSKKDFFISGSKPDWNKILVRKVENKSSVDNTLLSGTWGLDQLFSKFKARPEQFQCYCIQVKEDDGMSWAAETLRLQVKDEVARTFSKFEIHSLSMSDKGRLPLISKIFGESKFVRIAEKNNVVDGKSLLSITALIKSIVYLVPFVTAITVGLVTDDLKEHGLPILFSLKYFFIFFITLAFFFTGQYILTRSKKKAITESANDFIDKIEEYSKKLVEGDQTFENRKLLVDFVTNLTEELIHIKPKFLILEKFELFDSFSKIVINQYFETYKKPEYSTREQKECWVFFEGSIKGIFSDFKADIHDKKRTAFEHIDILQLKPVTNEEKKVLIQAFGLPAENIKFTSIKSICRNKEGFKWIKENLKEFRKKNPVNNQFGKLDLLYLMALTAIPFKVPLTDKELNTIFTNDKDRSELLKAFMYNKDFSPNAINYVKGKLIIDSDLKDIIEVVKADFKGEHYMITYEGAYVLNRDSALYSENEDDEFFNGLSLPNGNIGHAFWAVYWYDRLQSHPYEALWFQKLNFHLTHFDFQTIREVYKPTNQKKTINGVLLYVLDSYIYTLGGCIRTAMWDKIIPLIKCGNAAIGELKQHIDFTDVKEAEKSKDFVTKIEHFQAKCWEAWVCLRQKEILDNIVNLNKTYFECSQLAPSKNPNHLFYEAYVEMIAGHSEKISKYPERYYILSQKETTTSPLENHIILEATLLGLYLKPLSMFELALDIFEVHDKGIHLLDNIIENTATRILSSTAQNFNIVDLVNWSQCIWIAYLHASNEMGTVEDLKKYIAIIETTSRVLYHINNNESGRNKSILKNEFFANAVFAEIAGVALISSASYSIMDLKKEYEEELAGSINKLLKSLADIFSIDFTNTLSLKGLTYSGNPKKITNFLQGCAALWNQLNCPYLLHGFTQKIFYFEAFINRFNFSALTNIINQEPFIINSENHYLNLLTSLIKADITKKIQRKYSYIFFDEALKTLSMMSVSPKMAQQFSFMKLTYQADTAIEFSQTDSDMLAAEDSYITKTLNKIKETELDSFIIVLAQLQNESTNAYVNMLINKRIEELEDPDIKFYLQGMMEFFSFKFSPTEVNEIEQVMQKWKPYRAYWFYPSLLSMVLERNFDNQHLVEECNDILQRDPKKDNINGYFILSYNLGSTLMRQNKLSRNHPAVNYLEKTISLFEKASDEQTNKMIYLMLSKYGNETTLTDHYSNKYVMWEKVYNEEQCLKFKSQVEIGNYFTAFSSIAESLRESDYEDAGNYFISPNKDSQAEEAVLPFIEINNKIFISDDFINSGKKYFSNGEADNPALKDKRSFYNRIAKSNISRILKFILHNRDISERVKDVITHYDNIITEFTMPEEEE